MDLILLIKVMFLTLHFCDSSLDVNKLNNLSKIFFEI